MPAHPLEVRGVEPSELLVLNLCFHGIGTPHRSLEPGEQNYWVSPAQFDEMLEVVAANPRFRISFDDGNASDLDLAMPALLQRGIRAEFFVLAGRLGHAGSLGPSDLRELVRKGMSIGSHGLAHRPWRKLDRVAAAEEFGRAREILGGVTGRPVDHAACPFGAYDRSSLLALRRQGYSRVFTVDEGPAQTDHWLQDRFTVLASDSAERLLALASQRRPGLVARNRRRLRSLAKRLR